MLTSQKHLLRASEIKSKLNELANADSPTAEQVTEIDKLRGELTGVEAQYRAAVSAEDAASRESTNEETPEGRERESLRQRASIGAFVDSRLKGRHVDGAEEEYRAAVGATPGSIPLGMFEPRTRAITNAPTTNTPNNNDARCSLRVR